MNYEPGQKVKVNVNGVEWEDEIVSVKDRLIKNDEWLYQLKSGLIAPAGTISPAYTLEPERMPYTSDIVEVWHDKKIPDHPILRIFDRAEKGFYVVKEEDGSESFWENCRIAARRPMRWEEFASSTQVQIMVAFKTFDCSSCLEEAYDKIICLIVGHDSYARIGE